MSSLPEETYDDFLRLARRTDCLIVGELHGTREIPLLLGALLDDLSAVGYGGLAMEIPESDREPITDWAAGRNEAVSEFFTHPPSDGRNSREVLSLLRRAERGGWQILPFDTEEGPELETWQSRDRAMAENLAEQWDVLCPDRKVLALCGNLHSRLTPVEPFLDLWPSFAACLRDLLPEREVRALRIQFHGGGFFNNSRVNALPALPFDRSEIREDHEEGHSYVLNLPRATPATLP